MNENEENKEDMMEEELDNIIVLTDENGNDAEFEWLDTVEMNEKTYIVVIPKEDTTDEVIILEMTMDGEEETFIGVEDEKTVNEVFEIFKENNKENFDFID